MVYLLGAASEVVSACLACGGLREGESGEVAQSAKAWWAGGAYQEALEEVREKYLTCCDTYICNTFYLQPETVDLNCLEEWCIF